MKQEITALDFYGIINLVRALVRQGHCTEQEAQRIAGRIAKQFDISVSFSL